MGGGFFVDDYFENNMRISKNSIKKPKKYLHPKTTW